MQKKFKVGDLIKHKINGLCFVLQILSVEKDRYVVKYVFDKTSPELIGDTTEWAIDSIECGSLISEKELQAIKLEEL